MTYETFRKLPKWVRKVIMNLSEGAKQAALQYSEARLSQVDAELATKTEEYNQQTEPLRAQLITFENAFSNENSSLLAERETLTQDISELKGENAAE